MSWVIAVLLLVVALLLAVVVWGMFVISDQLQIIIRRLHEK